MTNETPSQVEQTIQPLLDQVNIANIDYLGLLDTVVAHGTKILLAFVIFWVGKWVVRRLIKLVRLGMERAEIDPTLQGFLANILFGIGMAFVVIAALSQMGIETTSLAAVIGAAGLAIGLALQGSLSNFAAGVLIILFQFFKKGHYVEVAGVGGTVQDISILTTQLLTPSNEFLIIPNSSITTSPIINYSKQPKRRIDLVIGVAYDADLKKARKIFEKILAADERILEKPESQVAVSELGASSVDFIVRPWVKSKDYWATRFDLLEKIKVELDKAGIGIPFPQRDVNLFIREGEIPATKKGKKTA